MTCSEVHDCLDAYLDRSLDRERRAAVDAHLTTCADCRAAYETASWLRQRTAALPRQVAPSRDLWSGIAPRLARRPRRYALPLSGLVAAALLLVASSATITLWLTRSSSPAVSAFASTEAGYLSATLELTELYARARETMTPETRAVLERNLEVIERALGEARAALRSDPADRALEAIVATAYRRKIEFLERATLLDRES